MTDATLDQRFADAMGALVGPDFPDAIGLAVSGGGDSMAMLALAHGWARRFGVSLHVVTVDHGLRPEAADEAAMVAEECALLGHSHDTLRWQWDGQGNKLDAARRARLALYEAWRGDLRQILLAHTRDDLAESFVMRLARGAGVDGLAAMAPARQVGAMMLLRPCLGMTRAELRHYATVLQVPFVDDPSNDDPAYDRARVRHALPALDSLGLTRGTLADTAERLRDERAALAARAVSVWDRIGTEEPWGGLSLSPDWAQGLERATQRRLLNAALCFVAAADYGPRAAALESFRDTVLSGGDTTLHGCQASYIHGRLTIFREYAAVKDHTLPAQVGAIWDGRWRLKLSNDRGLSIAPLGQAGWQQLGGGQGGPPHRAALSLPALWQRGACVACPALGHGASNTFDDMRQAAGGMRSFLLSH